MKLWWPLIFVFFFFYKTSVAQTLISEKYPIQVVGKPSAKKILFYVSGDGGWNDFSQRLTASLASDFIVVGIDSRKYFWSQKTPDEFAKAMSEIITYYLRLYGKEEFSLIGYSFGADVLAFLPDKINTSLLSKLKTMVLLSPSSSTDFVIRLSGMLGINHEGRYKIIPELLKIKCSTTLIFGKDEDHQVFGLLRSKTEIKTIEIPGAHKYNDVSVVSQTVKNSIGF